MKIFLFLLMLFISLALCAQGKKERTVLAKARSLHNAVFISRDSVELEKLFSDQLSYGHSSGKVENRQQAIQGIIHNRSVYNDVNLGPTSVRIEGKTAVTRYLFSASELTGEGRINPLKLHIMLVWKKKKNWKLMARQAVRVQ